MGSKKTAARKPRGKRASGARDDAPPITFAAVEAARILNVGRSTLYRMIERGELARDAAGRVEEAELRRFLEGARARAKAVAGLASPAQRDAAAQAIAADFEEVIAQGATGRNGARPYHLEPGEGLGQDELDGLAEIDGGPGPRPRQRGEASS